MQSHSNKQLASVAGLVIIAMMVVVGVSATAGKRSDQAAAASSMATPNPAQPVSTTSTPTATTASLSGYKDGTYTATGTFTTPESYEEISVTVTLSNGVVTSASASSSPGGRESARYLSNFMRGYKGQVVGKSIKSVNLSRVSGSSLTTRGFDIAMGKIKSQAKA